MARRKKEQKIENEESFGSKIMSVFFVILIVFVWLAIVVALIKFDVGGVGNTMLRPVLKDIPVLSKILTKPSEEQLEQEAEQDMEDGQIATLSQAKAMIEQLQSENEELSQSNKSLKEQNSDLSKEVERLKVFEENQTLFQREKEEFYQEIVYGENAPDADTYIEWYESIDAANAEVIYRQIISEEYANSELKDIAKTYENMKPAEAAAVLEKMKDNLDVVTTILGAMKADSRAKIMDQMDPAFAANVTKKLMP